MITPRFHIEQTESDLLFTIYAPYASIADAEIYADLDTFCFYASPYYLRLHLSGFIEETDSSKGSYDADKGTFILCVQKVNKGEHFENLDLVTSLLTPSQHQKRDIAKPVIEVINSDELNEESVCIGDDDDEGSEWYIDQCPFEEQTEDFLMKAPHYGFANKLSGAFHNFKTEFLEVIEVPDPDKTPITERSRMRLEKESKDFSDDHYLADWVQPDTIESMLSYRHHWNSGDIQINFLDEEIDILKDFPKKEFLLDKKEEHIAYLSLVDILFAYAYNARTTLGENTVESAWTVNKISATLSWLQHFSSLKEAMSAPIRRSLCYPLYRHWQLSMKVLDDVKSILLLGKRQILKCLLEVYSLFNMSEPRYILNQLYIRDYCIWIQHSSDSQIKSLFEALEKVKLSKCDIDFDLDELEKAAEIVLREERDCDVDYDSNHHKKSSSAGRSNEKTLCSGIAALALSKTSVAGDSSSGTSDSEDDSSSSSDDSSNSSQSSDLDSDDLSDRENAKQ